MTDEPTYVPREDAEVMLPMTAHETLAIMGVLVQSLRQAPDAVLASAFAWLRESMGEYFREHPDAQHIQAHLAQLMQEEFGG